MGDALPDLQKTQSLNSNSKENAKEVQGMKIDRVLAAVKPKSEIQDVGSCFLKRCDSVARRSKAYEARCKSACENSMRIVADAGAQAAHECPAHLRE